LQAIYNYQRTVLNAYTEVINRLAKVDNYRESVGLKLEQVKSLENSVDVATELFLAAHPDVQYIDVLFAQRDLLDARTVLIETKQQQLSAIVNVYQALGGGVLVFETVEGEGEPTWMPPEPQPDQIPPAPEEQKKAE
jgi:outer membrane protein TolC